MGSGGETGVEGAVLTCGSALGMPVHSWDSSVGVAVGDTVEFREHLTQAAVLMLPCFTR